MKNSAIADKCSECEGRLVDYDDYNARRAVKLGLGALPAAVLICAAWAPLFFIIRLLIGGAIGNVGAAALVILLLKKVLVGVVLGALIAAAVGIGRSDLGLLFGAVIGSLGGFFVAAAQAMPLRSDAAHRLDVVLVAVIAGILCAATVPIAEKKAKKKFAAWIGPDPRPGSGDTEGAVK